MIANSFVRNAWYVAGMAAEFKTDDLRGMVIAKKPVVIWRGADGKVVAFDDRCVHKRMPLSCGKILANGTIECAYHGFTYDTTGKCVAIPSQMDLPIPTRAKLRPFPVVEQDGVVWLWAGDPARMGATRPPRTPEFADREFESFTCEPIHVPANYRLLIENLLDITHFYPLHDGNIGDLANSKIPIEFIEQEIDGNPSMKTIRRVQNYRHPPFLQEWFGYEVVDREHTHCMVSPGITRVQLRCAPPGRLGTPDERGYILHHSHTPIDETHHLWRWTVTVRKGQPSLDPATPSIERIKAMFPAVVDQDRWALERQQTMFNYDEDGYAEVHLRSDRSILTVRKILDALEQREAQPASQAQPAADKAVVASVDH
ncbi:MAG: aromatic ring-hydroxylating dioxygenase subunit alpha [Casimicrobiaceae bacterium]